MTDKIKVFPLYSGSKGNSTFIETEDERILIDAGTTKTKIQNKLKSVNLGLKDINAILITHCHTDHIKALKDVMAVSEATVYCAEETIDRVYFYLDDDEKKRVEKIAGQFSLKNTVVTPFPLPHDVCCTGYKIISGGSAFSYLTDLGYFDENLLKVISGSEKVLLEANHDVDLLKKGSYPYLLKRRILSDMGHLSNDSCAAVCEKLFLSGTKEFILGHLSEENNCPELAYDAVALRLNAVGGEYKLFVTTRNGLNEIV